MSNAAPSAFMCCSAKCTTVTQIEARKQILKRNGHCFCCLRKGHIGRECRSSVCPREHPQQSSDSASNPNNPTPTATNAASNVTTWEVAVLIRLPSTLMLLLPQTRRLPLLHSMYMSTSQYSYRRHKPNCATQ